MPRLCSSISLIRYIWIFVIMPNWLRRRREKELAKSCGFVVIDLVHVELWKKLVSISRASLRRRSSRRRDRIPLPILLYGPPGNGKAILARRLASHFGMNYFEVDCYSLWSEVPGTAEAKLRNALTQTSDSTPCVFVLKHVDVVGKDSSTNDHDVRVIACFKNLLMKSDRSLIIIGTASKREHIAPSLSSAFLYQLSVELPNERERLLLIAKLTAQYSSMTDMQKNPEYLRQLAKRTSGFGVADIERFIEIARFLAKERGCGCSLGTQDVVFPVEWKDFESALFQEQAKLADAVGAPSIPSVQWDDVGALTDVKDTLLGSIRFYMDYPELSKIGFRRSGILLFGPPGCGKTLIAKAVATECGLNFLSVKGPELLNMYVGQSEQNVREVFERARSASPCVIFFDELDALAPNRGRSGDSGGVMDRVVSQLLAEMDGLERRGDLFIIGATNRVDLIDPSLVRPGRFDKAIYVGLRDDFDSRLSVFNAVIRRLALDSTVNKEEIISQCPPGMSGADFYALAAEAAVLAAQRKIEEILELKRQQKGEDSSSSDESDIEDNDFEYNVLLTQTDFLRALTHLKPSINSNELANYQGSN